MVPSLGPSNWDIRKWGHCEAYSNRDVLKCGHINRQDNLYILYAIFPQKKRRKSQSESGGDDEEFTVSKHTFCTPTSSPLEIHNVHVAILCVQFVISGCFHSQRRGKWPPRVRPHPPPKSRQRPRQRGREQLQLVQQ